MKSRLFYLMAMLVIASLALSACGPAATEVPVQPQAPTEVPAQPSAPTEAPTAAPAFTAKYNLTAPDCSYGGEIKSIEALDQYTVKFTLCTPDPAFLSKVAFPVYGIQSAAHLEKTGGGGEELLNNPVGTGPYMVKEWVRGDHLTLVPNPNYWGPAPKNKEFIIRWNSEAAARLLELQAGTADVIDNPSPDDFDKIQADSSLKLLTRTGLNVFYLGFNNTHKPFDNEKVRQALAMALDKKRIVDNYYPAGSLPAEQFVPPVMVPGYVDGFKWYDYDVAGAKKLLAEAGFPNGFSTTLSYRDVVRVYLPLPSKVGQEIQSQLAQIGVKVQLEPIESGKFLASVAAGEQPMFMLGWGADYPDPTNFYDFHFTGASKNFGDVYPDLVDAIHAAGQVADPAQRNTLYAKVAELVKQHVPMVPVAHGTNGIAYKATVDGQQASPLADEQFNLMSVPGQDQLNFIQNGEPISLYCADETDGETLRPCYHIFDTLYWYKPNTSELVPAAAESYQVSTDLKEWTFTLRKDMKFSDGTPMDANDVVETFVVQWDASNPLHKGNTGVFEYFSGYFAKQLNAK
ncbi:MAG TPA: ABC transporter substrate-binding protein [Anaerolineales bacterium]|nr:ABC transporter substrate-binding protein [Anaerolineales bacterium]